MKSILLVAAAIFLLSNCGPLSYTVHISNQSGKAFDSVSVRISSTQGGHAVIKFDALQPGQPAQKTIPASMVNARHDIAVVPVFYAKDTVVKDFGIYNDLGIFKANYQLTIDSAYRVTWKEW
jgi:hypothetical protein